MFVGIPYGRHHRLSLLNGNHDFVQSSSEYLPRFHQAGCELAETFGLNTPFTRVRGSLAPLITASERDADGPMFGFSNAFEGTPEIYLSGLVVNNQLTIRSPQGPDKLWERTSTTHDVLRPMPFSETRLICQPAHVEGARSPGGRSRRK